MIRGAKEGKGSVVDTLCSNFSANRDFAGLDSIDCQRWYVLIIIKKQLCSQVHVETSFNP